MKGVSILQFRGWVEIAPLSEPRASRPHASRWLGTPPEELPGISPRRTFQIDGAIECQEGELWMDRPWVAKDNQAIHDI